MLALDDTGLFRSAGYSAVLGAVSLVAAGITLALFFGGAGHVWGPVNDIFDAVMLLAIILPVLAVDRLAGPAAQSWVRIVTVAALAGLMAGAAFVPLDMATTPYDTYCLWKTARDNPALAAFVDAVRAANARRSG